MNRLQCLRHVVAQVRSIPITAGPLTEPGIRDLGFAMGRIFLETREYVGIGVAAGEALHELADAIYSGSARYRRGSVYAEFLDELLTALFGFRGRDSKTISNADLVALENRLQTWFAARAAIHTLYIPCAITAGDAPRFDIGPVSFVHLIDFDQWRNASWTEFDNEQFGRLRELMLSDGAAWIASVDVFDAHPSRAREIGDISVDLALAGIQLVLHADHSARIARLNARSIPHSCIRVSTSDGQFCVGYSNQAPCLALGAGALEGFVNRAAPVLAAVGNRIRSYVAPGPVVPRLNQAWCDAAYWYHEGLAESLETIAVTKLETAIEVLFGAESSSGSERRILTAVRAFHGLEANDFINPNSQTTVKQFAKGFVRDRSCILHGTLSTLETSFGNTRASLAGVVHGFLVRYAMDLDEYIAAGEGSDKVDDLLGWIQDRNDAMQRATRTTASA